MRKLKYLVTAALVLAALAVLYIALVARVPQVAADVGAQQETPTPAPTPGDEELISMGAPLFASSCAACHGQEGQGVQEGLGRNVPPHAGNPFVTAENTAPLIETVLFGRGGMPAFRFSLSATEVAAVLSYIRNSFGNEAAVITPDEVEGVQEEVLTAPTATPGPTATPAPEDLIAMGEAPYTDYCAACHGADGQGVQEGLGRTYPPHAGNPFVTAENPVPVIQTVLFGRGGMPRFGTSLSTTEVAAIVSYMRNAFGNEASAITPEQVEQAEEEMSTPVP